MATYIKGASGACVDCSYDDPCSEGFTECLDVNASTSAGINQVTRLRDTSPTNIQMHIVDAGSGGMRAVYYNGSTYTLGPLYTGTGSSPTMSGRTSHAGDTFFTMSSSGPTIRAWTVNPSTLALSITASATLSYTGTDFLELKFLDDDVLMLVSRTRTGSVGSWVFTIYFQKITITGGGTGFSIGAAITKTYFTSVAFLVPNYGGQRVDDGRGVFILGIEYAGSTFSTEAIFVDCTGSIAFGSTVVVNTNYTLLFGRAFNFTDEGAGGCIFWLRSLGSDELIFITWNTVGTPLSISNQSRVCLNSATVGVMADQTADLFYPLSISGTTITAGTPVSSGGRLTSTHVALVANGESSSTYYYTSSGVPIVGCILT